MKIDRLAALALRHEIRTVVDPLLDSSNDGMPSLDNHLNSITIEALRHSVTKIYRAPSARRARTGGSFRSLAASRPNERSAAAIEGDVL
jgi:hypothetical protein